jgi:HK97 family phage major capsid protein
MRAGDGTEGGYLIPDEVSSELVGLTIANMPVMKMGTTQLTGLVGELPIPRQTARNTGFWVGETEAPTESSITFDQFTLRPKKAGALTRFSNRLLYQTRGLINNIVKESISDSLALLIDAGFLNGTGSDSQPKGILQQTGLTTTPNQATSAVRFRLDKAASMIQAIDVANELKDGGNFGFIMRPEVQGGMRRERIPQFTGQALGQGQPIGGPMDLLMSNEQLASRIGYKIETTNQLSNSQTRGTSTSSSTVIFGNFKQMYTGFWRGMEIKVSNIATVGGVDAFSRDFVWVVAFQEVDCNFGRLTAFTLVEDAETNEALWTNG